MKRKKAAKKDGIGKEAWLYSDRQIRVQLIKVLKRVWRRERFPEESKESLILPPHKKRDVGRVENYSGITLLNAAYKIYAGMLNDRLEKRYGRERSNTEDTVWFQKRKKYDGQCLRTTACN